MSDTKNIGGGEWKPMFVLPNIRLEDPIEAISAALLPSHDHRILGIAETHPEFAQFLDRFTDAFGVRNKPAVLVIQDSVPISARTIDAVANFRDLISLCVIPYNRALDLIYGGGRGRILFSNFFWLYPWMLGKDYQLIILDTPALRGIHVVEEFHGQCSPELSPATLRNFDIDKPLFNSLSERWYQRYILNEQDWKHVALFRSLNMANQASQFPAGSDTTLYDVGRMISLWVSAFEILVHPEVSESGYLQVYELLQRINFLDPEMSSTKHEAYAGRKKNATGHTIACCIYGELNRARNDFLHGEPIPENRLMPKDFKVSLFRLAAPLYRIALTGFLNLTFTSKPPPADQPEAFAKYLSYRATFKEPQSMIERALLRSH